MEPNCIDSRPSWDEYFVGIMDALSERATCDRGKCACVIVKNNQILSSGYVGSPPGLPHCDTIGHLMMKVVKDDGYISKHCVRTVHAEANAICQAAKFGVALNGATLYCKMEPCSVCCKMIISVGIERVVALYEYHAAQITRELFKLSGVKLEVLNKKNIKYE